MSDRYSLSAKALADLADIWDYSARHWGEAQAERYVRAIHPVAQNS